jgi:oligopeptidase B
MGAVVNMRPDLFRAVVLNVPFVDVINTMLDETLPLSTGEFLQWGNPKVKEDFDYMIQYSPYDNVKKQKYPLMLFTTGIMDKQVGYWEPTKMVARLRKLNPEGLPVLLRCEMKSGHSGGSALTKRITERAFEHAFILSSVGINE